MDRSSDNLAASDLLTRYFTARMPLSSIVAGALKRRVPFTKAEAEDIRQTLIDRAVTYEHDYPVGTIKEATLSEENGTFFVDVKGLVHMPFSMRDDRQRDRLRSAIEDMSHGGMSVSLGVSYLPNIDRHWSTDVALTRTPADPGAFIQNVMVAACSDADAKDDPASFRAVTLGDALAGPADAAADTTPAPMEVDAPPTEPAAAAEPMADVKPTEPVQADAPADAPAATTEPPAVEPPHQAADPPAVAAAAPEAPVETATPAPPPAATVVPTTVTPPTPPPTAVAPAPVDAAAGTVPAEPATPAAPEPEPPKEPVVPPQTAPPSVPRDTGTSKALETLPTPPDATTAPPPAVAAASSPPPPAAAVPPPPPATMATPAPQQTPPAATAAAAAPVEAAKPDVTNPYPPVQAAVVEPPSPQVQKLALELLSDGASKDAIDWALKAPAAMQQTMLEGLKLQAEKTKAFIAERTAQANEYISAYGLPPNLATEFTKMATDPNRSADWKATYAQVERLKAEQQRAAAAADREKLQQQLAALQAEKEAATKRAADHEQTIAAAAVAARQNNVAGVAKFLEANGGASAAAPAGLPAGNSMTIEQPPAKKSHGDPSYAKVMHNTASALDELMTWMQNHPATAQSIKQFTQASCSDEVRTRMDKFDNINGFKFPEGYEPLKRMFAEIEMEKEVKEDVERFNLAGTVYTTELMQKQFETNWTFQEKFSRYAPVDYEQLRSMRSYC